MKLIIDALHKNTFKKVWSARLTVVNGSHVSCGCVVEAKTKKDVIKNAQASIPGIIADYGVTEIISSVPEIS